MPLPRTFTSLLLALGLTAGGGCSAINGLYFGLEEDVDALVRGLDAAGDRLLPYGPRPPFEATRDDRTDVRFRPVWDVEAPPPAPSARHRHGPGRNATGPGPKAPTWAAPSPPASPQPDPDPPPGPMVVSGPASSTGPTTASVPRHYRLVPAP